MKVASGEPVAALKPRHRRWWFRAAGCMEPIVHADGDQEGSFYGVQMTDRTGPCQNFSNARRASGCDSAYPRNKNANISVPINTFCRHCQAPRQRSLECAKAVVDDTARNKHLLRGEGLLPATHPTAAALSAIARAAGSLSTRRQQHPATDRHMSDGTKFLLAFRR